MAPSNKEITTYLGARLANIIKQPLRQGGLWNAEASFRATLEAWVYSIFGIDDPEFFADQHGYFMHMEFTSVHNRLADYIYNDYSCVSEAKQAEQLSKCLKRYKNAVYKAALKKANRKERTYG